MGIIRELKYKKIENFLSQDEINLLDKYTQFKHRVNEECFDIIQNKNGDTFFYEDPLMEALMVNKIPLMQKETGLELLPTYAFWRMYTKFADLEKHKDRESCEVSVTVMIGSDGTSWPIYMDGNKVDLKPGDAVVYLGCELEHWREEFTGDWHAQTFLHYVDKNGPNKDWAFDRKNKSYYLNDF